MVAITGRVVSGLGEGALYVELYRSFFIKYLQIDPFPGTLNIEVEDPGYLNAVLSLVNPVKIPPPKPGLGGVSAYKALLRGLVVYIVRPEKTSHNARIVEVVSDRYLRGYLKLKDGDAVVLQLMV